MGATLKRKSELAATRRQIAEDNLAAAKAGKFLNYINENLRPSRKRKFGWSVPGAAERDMSTSDRKKAMGLARQKVEEHWLIAAMLDARLDNIVGIGPRLVMRSGDRDFDKEVESLWAIESDKLDIRGVRTWGRLMRCIQARHDVDGDVGGVLASDEFKGKPKQWVQIIEADRISKDPEDAADFGIDFDEYGMAKKFYVWDRVAKSKTKPYDPREFFFYIADPTERAERKRGVSLFIPALNLIEDYNEIMDGIVQKVKNEAFIGIKFWMQPGGDGNLFGSAQEAGTGSSTEIDYSRVKMVPGMNLVLADGEQADVLESKSPHAEFDAFEKKLIARIAFKLGLTYELVTGDYSGINYSSSRAMFEQVKKRIRVEQAGLGAIASRIFQFWIGRQVKFNVIKPPKGMENNYWTHRWGMPGFPYINPQQEAEAQDTLLSLGLTSRTRILADTGGDDIDDILDDLEYEKQSAVDRKVDINGKQPAQQKSVSQPLVDGTNGKA